MLRTSSIDTRPSTTPSAVRTAVASPTVETQLCRRVRGDDVGRDAPFDESDV
jgi:hypothetical protein